MLRLLVNGTPNFFHGVNDCAAFFLGTRFPARHRGFLGRKQIAKKPFSLYGGVGRVKDATVQSLPFLLDAPVAAPVLLLGFYRGNLSLREHELK